MFCWKIIQQFLSMYDYSEVYISEQTLYLSMCCFYILNKHMILNVFYRGCLDYLFGVLSISIIEMCIVVNYFMYSVFRYSFTVVCLVLILILIYDLFQFFIYLTCAAIHAIDSKNNTPLYGKIIRVSWSHKDPLVRKSGVGNVFVKVLVSARFY